jgi:ferritin
MDKEVLDLLNEQIWMENHSSSCYLDLAIEFAEKGFNGMSQFFFNQAEEERQHMLKLINYVLERDEKPIIPQYNYLEPNEETFDVLFHFECALKQEKKVSEQVSKVVYASRSHSDIMTDNFMQWYVNEQREEEAKFKDILDKLKMVGDNGLGIYEIDKELGSIENESTTTEP